ncbi:MAG: FAD:protein FMN transferase [Alphaproteobacteria bacterium]|nr:MAG: FAD:protein FMN transferase [Alphaproteobacteria bacterium]
MPGLSRRRFLAISAAAVAVAPGAEAATASWRGQALGARASITLGGVGHARAEETFAAVTAEIERLERIFSLYRPESALSRLNAAGRLAAPPAELVETLALCDRLFAATGGAFDPSIQPLWTALAGGRDGKNARRAVGWPGVRVSAAEIAFRQPGMALTLNGVAQGYITDAIARLLVERGYRNVLVDIGELRALGTHHGTPWVADVAAPGGRAVRRLTLSDRALAVSATLGTLLDRRRGTGHILDPRTGSGPPLPRLVAVSAPSAVLADGLSTGCCLLSGAEARLAVAAFPGARLECHRSWRPGAGEAGRAPGDRA